MFQTSIFKCFRNVSFGDVKVKGMFHCANIRGMLLVNVLLNVPKEVTFKNCL